MELGVSMANIKDLKIYDYIRTDTGELAQVCGITNEIIETDIGSINPMSILKYRPKLLELIEDGDYINGARVYKRNDSGVLCINGHSIYSCTEPLQLMTKQKFYHNCYSPGQSKFINIQWKQIKDFPLYKVSSTGIVKAINSDKIMSPLRDRETLSVRLECPDGRRLRKSVAVLVLETFKEDANGRLPKFLDGNNQNCSLTNLEWETREEQAKRVLPKRTQPVTKYKYHNIVGYYQGVPIVYAEHSGAMTQFLKMHCDDAINLKTNHFTRNIRTQTPYKGLIFKTLNDEDYQHVIKTINLKEFDKFYRDNIHDTKDQTHIKVAKQHLGQPKKVEPKPVKVLPKAKEIKTKLDDLSDDDFIKDMEQQKRDKFKEELLKRLGGLKK